MDRIRRLISEIRDYGIKNEVPIMSEDTINTIIKIIKDNNIKSILEIGSAIGYSTICFASCNIDKITSIEVTNNDGSTREIPISCLFVAIGQVPVTENFVKLIDVDNNGYAIAGEDMKTKIPGVYVAGDVRKKSLRQLATAISDGAIAATEAIHDIQNNII